MRACLTCGAPIGRRVHRNRRYGSAACRRRMEMRRRAWEAHRRSITFYEANANLPDRTPVQRRTWLKKAEEARRTLGERP
jgi:hypothetical protein